MSVVILFTFILLGFVFLTLKHYRKATKLLYLTLVWFIAVSFGLVPEALVGGLQKYEYLVKPTWGKANVIIVLGAATTQSSESRIVRLPTLAYSRVLEAARLYFDCKDRSLSCTLLASGGDPQHHGLSEAEVMGRELEGLKIPKSDIILEGKSLNTFQNARYSTDMIKVRNYDKVVLVTSGLHMRRALKFFQHFKLDPEPAPSDETDTSVTPYPLALNFAVTDFALKEFTGLAFYRFYEILNLNKN